MAQQTINVGTAPNDGTGTPLRTAFQYTNSNFSELYTAVGPSGNNIVVPGNATITGDLTVDTSTLKVDSANNRVGIGTASPAYPLDVTGNINSSQEVYSLGGRLALYRSAGASYLDWATSQDLVWRQVTTVGGAGASTLMTLNSTGLGVGRSPSYRLQASSGTKATTASLATVAGITTTDADDFGIYFRLKTDATGANRYAAITSFDNGSGNGARDLVLQDLGGNVGVGVTPSAWQSNFKAFELGRVGNAIATYTAAGGAADLYISSNAYYNGGFKYANSSQTAGVYSVTGNVHAWYTAASGTAGNAITDFATAKMTLDASGNLLVGTTNTSTTAGVGFKSLYNATVPSLSMVVNDAAGTGAAYLLYNTNAAAYRFYVANSGTIFATNTTISAISDQRLKENVQDIDVGLGAILALKPRKFDWKEGKGKNIKGDRGFIAQEFEQVFPNLIDEWKDSAPEGEAPYKSVRQDLIPVLVKAIQELAARVEALEA